jgi:hypothetical protein
VPVSAVRLLRLLPARRARRQRLQHRLLLAARVGALVVLAVAFARPYVMGSGPFAAGPLTVIALDTSLSRSAPGQFERARAAARAIARRAGPGRDVGLVAFSDAAWTVQPPTPDRARLLAAIDRLAPGAAATRYPTALARAGELATAGGGRVVLVTDLQLSGWTGDDRGAMPPGVDVEVEDVGAPDGNLAVIDLRRVEAGSVASIRNIGPVPRVTSARLVIGRQVAAVTTVTLPAGATVDAAFNLALPPAGAASVEIDDPTGYAADNVRYLLLDPPLPLRVLLAVGKGNTGGAFYVQRALAADSGRTFAADVRDGAAIDRMAPADFQAYAAVMLLGTGGLGAPGRAALRSFVERGGGMLVAAGSDVDPTAVGDLVGADFVPSPARRPADRDAVGLVAADARHPVFTPLAGIVPGLESVRVARWMSLAGVDARGAGVLARLDTGAAAIVESRRGAGRVIVVASDLGNRWNDLPRQPVFVPLMHELARYLAAGREPPRELLVGDAPSAAGRVPGVVAVGVARSGQGGAGLEGDAGRGPTRVALNVDPAESDPARQSLAEFRAAVARLGRTTASGRAPVTAAAAEDRQRGWRYGLALVMAILIAEAFMARRAA